MKTGKNVALLKFVNYSSFFPNHKLMKLLYVQVWGHPLLSAGLGLSKLYDKKLLKKKKFCK